MSLAKKGEAGNNKENVAATDTKNTTGRSFRKSAVLIFHISNTSNKEP